MLKMLVFLLGFGLSVIGFMYIITYLNYLSIGMSFKEYLKFILTRGECLLALVGLLIILFLIFSKR